jgi:hypothetical protein
MKVKTLDALVGKGRVADQSGSPLSLVKPETKKIAYQLGVPEERLLDVINSNSKALLLIVEALASQQPVPQVNVTIPPTRGWTISFTRNSDNLIESARLTAD